MVERLASNQKMEFKSHIVHKINSEVVSSWLACEAHNLMSKDPVGSSPTLATNSLSVQWSGRCPVTAEIMGSIPI